MLARLHTEATCVLLVPVRVTGGELQHTERGRHDETEVERSEHRARYSL